jgi:hypothetical protein
MDTLVFPGKALGRRTWLVGGVLLALLLARLAVFAVELGTESLQLDFSATYAAAEAARRGLDPYQNHALREPPIWDGATTSVHARFTAPPLVAYAFVPLTFLPYGAAKWIFMIGSLVALGAALRLWGIALGFGSLMAVFLAAALMGLFHPVLALMERGPLDALALLPLSLAVLPVVRGERDRVWPGLWLALAVLIDLGLLLLVPFVALRRRPWALLGLLGGLVVVAGGTVAAYGYPHSLAFVRGDLGRIAVYGRDDPQALALPAEVGEQLRAGAPAGWTRRGDWSYRPQSFPFVLGASAPRALAGTALGAVPAAAAKASLAIAALGFALALFLVGRRRRPPLKLPPHMASGLNLGEAAFWQAALAVAVLASPSSSATNMVWLLPAALLAVRVVTADVTPTAKPARIDRWAAVTVLGLVLAAMPDHHSFALLLPDWGWLSERKYFLGEILLVLGGLFMTRAYYPALRGAGAPTSVSAPAVDARGAGPTGTAIR